ncbi:hypothetical protein R1flu_027833 [Riccia fluitans]|uniref:Uncharacterized protein n=1 Tax=Riccia fluitans TaxID=41844 RepID=A0ABD1XJY2_9MARC
MALYWFCKYEEALGILQKNYPNGKEAVAYIRAIDPRKFSRYALVLPRYGRVTSNAVECMNAAFLKLLEYVARHLLFEVWIYVMRSFYERRTAAEGSIELLTEYAKLNSNASMGDESTPIQRSVPVPPVLGGLDPTVLSLQLSELLEKVSTPSVPLEVLESQKKTCEDLTDRLVEAGVIVVALEAELKQKDEEIAALKERLQASEQKMQGEEARNAWLNEVTGTLRSEIQTLRSEGTKAKVIGKLPDRDWVHEAKQCWKANPSLDNMFRLSEALEEHEDQIVVREKMFLKHARY